MKKKILITDRFSQESFLFLQQSGLFEITRAESPQKLPLEKLGDVNCLLIRSRTRIDEALLKNTPHLQAVITATSGFDHIDLEATTRWGITVMNTPSANIESASQLTWALVLACCSKIVNANKSVKAGEWNRDPFLGTELYGRTYGIVGLGRIGSRVAQIARAFGMKVLAYDPYQEDERFDLLQVDRVSFEEVLKSSDVISFHVPKTLETDRMLNQSHFEYIQRGVILINTSRGSVINEADLVSALEKNYVQAAGLDVFEKEPLPRSSNLLQFPQVVLTPHIGAHTEEAFEKASRQAAEKALRFFVDGSTSDTLPPRVSWYGATPPWVNPPAALPKNE